MDVKSNVASSEKNGSRADLFLNLYRELESIASCEYGFKNNGSVIYELEQRKEFRNVRSELAYCREVRNLLSHNPQIRGAYTVEPSEEMIQLLQNTIDKIKRPLRAKDVMIRRDGMQWCSMNDFIMPMIRKMVTEQYTHIPILDDDLIVNGVFSESTLLSYFMEEGIIETNEDMRFKDLADYLPLKQHTSESFRFVAEDMLKTDVDEIFSAAMGRGERIGLAFVTHGGKEKERILGIITAWDLVDRM